MSGDRSKCPSCGGELAAQKKTCPQCGRWLAVRGISFYAFWTMLSLVVAALVGCILYAGFVMLNRML